MLTISHYFFYFSLNRDIKWFFVVVIIADVNGVVVVVVVVGWQPLIASFTILIFKFRFSFDFSFFSHILNVLNCLATGNKSFSFCEQMNVSILFLSQSLQFELWANYFSLFFSYLFGYSVSLKKAKVEVKSTVFEQEMRNFNEVFRNKTMFDASGPKGFSSNVERALLINT